MEWVIKKKAKERPEEWYSYTYMPTYFYFCPGADKWSKSREKENKANGNKAGNASTKMAPFKKS